MKMSETTEYKNLMRAIEIMEKEEKLKGNPSKETIKGFQIRLHAYRTKQATL